jgi:hypothetical protein
MKSGARREVVQGITAFGQEFWILTKSFGERHLVKFWC